MPITFRLASAAPIFTASKNYFEMTVLLSLSNSCSLCAPLCARRFAIWSIFSSPFFPGKPGAVGLGLGGNVDAPVDGLSLLSVVMVHAPATSMPFAASKDARSRALAASPGFKHSRKHNGQPQGWPLFLELRTVYGSPYCKSSFTVSCASSMCCKALIRSPWFCGGSTPWETNLRAFVKAFAP